MATWSDWIDSAGGIDLENLTEEVIVEYDKFAGPTDLKPYEIDFTDLVYLVVRIDSMAHNTLYSPNAQMYIDSDPSVRWGIGGPKGDSGTGILLNTMGLIGLHSLHFINCDGGSAERIGYVKAYRSQG